MHISLIIISILCIANVITFDLQIMTKNVISKLHCTQLLLLWSLLDVMVGSLTPIY